MSAMLQDVPQENLERADVHVALEAWARWAKSVFSGLGWPSVSIIGRIVKFGLSGAAQQHGVKILEIDSTCELVDRAIGRLDDTERETVIRTYLENDAAPVTARKCGLTYGYYRHLLTRSRRRIGIYLDAHRPDFG